MNPQEHLDLLDALRVSDNYAGELQARIETLEAEMARLKAAGLALAPHVVENDTFMDVLHCGACNVTMSDDDDFVHAADCPTRVFTDGTE